MASPLQKSPSGLLESYALKTLGEAPMAFGDLLVPVVETFDFYTTGLLFSAQESAVVQGFNATLANVISGPTMVRAIGCEFIEGAAAGTFLHWAFGIRVQSATITAWLANGSFGAIAAGATRRFGFMLERPVIVPPQSSIVGFFTSDAAGADHSFRMTRLTTEVNAVGVG